MNQTLKYCSFRLLFTILLFYPLLAAMGALSVENLLAFMGDDRPILLALFFLVLLLVSVLTSLLGKRFVVRKLESLQRQQDIKVKETIRSFERMLAQTYSAFFTPLSGERLRKVIIEEFADFLAKESIDELYSRNILETALMNGNASPQVEEFLAKIYGNQNRLDDQELYCAEIICLDRPNESALLDKIVDEYLSRRSTGVKARSIFRMALMRHQEKSLEIVYLLQKDYVNNGEIDELGAWVFLVISENRDEFNIDEVWFQERLTECYRKFGERDDQLAKRLESALERENAPFEKTEITTAVREEPPAAQQPLTIEEPALHREAIESELFKPGQFQKDLTRKESLPLYITAAALLGIIIFLFLFFFREETPQMVKEGEEPVTTVENEIPKQVDRAPDVKKEGKNAVVSDKPFTIQVAAYKTAKDAKRYVEQIRKKEKDAYVNIQEVDGDGVLYRVRLGFFGNQEEARAYATKLKEQGVISSFFISSFEGGVWELE